MAGTAEIDALTARYALPGQLHFHASDDGVLLADIGNRHTTAQIALQGAQVLAYQPDGAAPVLWMSPDARCRPGKAVRGGIPVCWPWFGPHPADPGKPAHGYARNAPWELRGASATADAVQLLLGLPLRPEYQALFPDAAALELTLAISVGAQLRLSLTTRNSGSASVAFSQALHSYFNISSIAAVHITGLEGCEYIDKVDGGVRKLQQGAVTIGGETDRVYLRTDADSLIHDPVLRRRIRIRHEGSRSTVVWNPWTEKAAKLGDLGPDGHRHMLCVESANAADDARRLAPGEEHTLTAQVGVEAAP
jgi:glucose-6-phosphate 1-epimerase